MIQIRAGPPKKRKRILLCQEVLFFRIQNSFCATAFQSDSMNKNVLSLLLVVLSLCIITIGSQQSLLTTLQMQRHLRGNKQAYQSLNIYYQEALLQKRINTIQISLAFVPNLYRC